MTVVVGFRCDITSCELARRGVRRGVVGVGESGGVRRVWRGEHAVGVTLILNPGQFF